MTLRGADEADSVCELTERMIRKHTCLGIHKALSYLPIRTIEATLGMSMESYGELVRGRGGNHMIFPHGTSCIESGAVFAYSDAALQAILEDYHCLLDKNDWPVDCRGFIRKIAMEWVDAANPITAVIKAAFGD